MISTDEHHETTALPFLQNPGMKMWRLVSLELRIPYFFVSYACKEGQAWRTQTSLLWYENDLLNFCRDACNNPSTKIRQIALLVPPGPEEIEIWHMFTLKEIWTARNRETHQNTTVYVGINGERFVKPSASDDPRQIELVEMAYPHLGPAACVNKIDDYGQAAHITPRDHR